MGFASPFRAMSTPVMNVVETAPQPTTMIPNLPVAGFTFVCFIIPSKINVLFNDVSVAILYIHDNDLYGFSDGHWYI